MNEREHPGTITYIDTEKGTERVERAEDTPEEHRFRNGVPVVKVVMSRSGERVFIQEFGPEGQVVGGVVGFA